MPLPPITQIRHALKAVCPPFLRGEQAYSFLNEGLFTLYDVRSELWWQSLFARFPTYCPADALPYLAADRRIITGPYESEEAIRARLRGWIDEAIMGGLPLGWLLALQAYVAPGYPKVRIVTRRSTWYTLEANTVPRMLGLSGYEPLPLCPYEQGPEWPREAVASQIERARCAGLYTRYKAPVANWDYDSVSNPERAAKWWDMWGIVYLPHYSTAGEYDGSGDAEVIYGSGNAVGFQEPYETLQTFKLIARARKPAKTCIRAVIFAGSADYFDPSTAPGDPDFPDGYWGAASKLVAGVATATRPRIHRYLLPPF